MGNDISSRKASSKATKRSGNLLVASWQRRKLPTQLFGVVRHAERADGVFAWWEGGRWSSSEDGRRFPLDPPLSDAGLEQADGMGAWINDYAQKKDSTFHVVVCSPYSRCVQTAVKICKQLGPNVKMLIDLSLGEIYGPSVMGEVQPVSHLRSFSIAVEYCRANGISMVPRLIGQAPAWPESLQDARRRFALRFLQYLQRGVVAKRNFLIITHGDCIGSVMGIMPDQQDVMVEKVDYGAMILGGRQRVDSRDTRPPKTPSSSKAMASVLPLSSQEEEMVDGQDFSHFQDRLQSVEEGLEELETLQSMAPDKWATPVDASGREEDVAKLSPHAMTGWQCETLNIATRSKKSSRSSKLAKRLNALVESGPFSMQKVEKLLGAIPQTPLGDSTPYCSTPANNSATLSMQSGLSASTVLFGQSEVDSEDFAVSLFSPSEGDSKQRVLSSNLDSKRHRPDTNIRSVSAAEKLSVKNYVSPLRGVQEVEERENSFKGGMKASRVPWPQPEASSSGGKIKRRAGSGISINSGNSLLNLANDDSPLSMNGQVDEILGPPPAAAIGIPGLPSLGFRGEKTHSESNGTPGLSDKVCTESCQTSEPGDSKLPKITPKPVGMSSALARRRASLNLKPLGE